MEEAERGNSFMIDGAVVYTGQYVSSSSTKGKSLHDTVGGASYQTVMTIALPFHIPHVLIFSRVFRGFARIFQPSRIQFNHPRPKRIKIRHEFSKFINVHAAPDQELTAFLYLAPNILDVLLHEGRMFTYEFIGDRIFVYHAPDRVVVVKGNQSADKRLAQLAQNDFTQLESGLPRQLIRAVRPAALQTPTDSIQSPVSLSMLGTVLRGIGPAFAWTASVVMLLAMTLTALHAAPQARQAEKGASIHDIINVIDSSTFTGEDNESTQEFNGMLSILKKKAAFDKEYTAVEKFLISHWLLVTIFCTSTVVLMLRYTREAVRYRRYIRLHGGRRSS